MTFRSANTAFGAVSPVKAVGDWCSEAWSNTCERVTVPFTGRGLPATQTEIAAWQASLREAEQQGEGGENTGQYGCVAENDQRLICMPV